MTEDDANKRWCPFVRNTLFSRNVAFVETNRGLMVNDKNKADAEDTVGWGYKCIASMCMAWQQKTSDDGHCGLVGKP